MQRVTSYKKRRPVEILYGAALSCCDYELQAGTCPCLQLLLKGVRAVAWLALATGTIVEAATCAGSTVIVARPL